MGQGLDSRAGPSPRRLLGYLLLAALLLFVLERVLDYGLKGLWDTQAGMDWLKDHRSWAWVVILALWQVQAVVAPLPAFLLTMATGLLYGDTAAGIIFAILLTWSGALLGAMVCFGLSRHFGREWVVRRGYLARMEDFDGYLEARGAYVILLTRLIPIISFDIISYAAGLTRVRWRDFVLATGLGMFPATMLLVLFAANALTTNQAGLAVISGAGLVLLAVASYLLVWLMKDYEGWKRSKRGAGAGGSAPEPAAEDP